jgi:hypothetical protein
LPAKASDQLNVPLNYFVGIVVTGALFAVTLGLWAGAARGTARNLCLSRRVRAAETVVVAVSAAAVFMMVSASMLFTTAIQSSAAQLLVGIAGSAGWGFIATRNLQRAVCRGSACGPAPGRA